MDKQDSETELPALSYGMNVIRSEDGEFTVFVAQEGEPGPVIAAMSVGGIIRYFLGFFIVVFALIGLMIFREGERAVKLSDAGFLMAVFGPMVCLFMLLSRRRLFIHMNALAYKGLIRKKTILDDDVAWFSLDSFDDDLDSSATSMCQRLRVRSRTGQRISFYEKLDLKDSPLELYQLRIASLISAKWVQAIHDGENLSWMGWIEFSPTSLCLFRTGRLGLGGAVSLDYSDIQCHLDKGKLKVYRKDSDKLLATVHSRERNFWPMMFTLQELSKGQAR